MTISKTQSGSALTIALEGRLDTVTSPELEKELKASMDAAEELQLDFRGLDYISSAGLRVLLAAHKVMSRKGGMKITGANDIVREVFDVTGFSDILTVE
ncbi:MAG: STAS domain-containing protein [Clostridia bacterium]|nr:STAS domain-containing protein [Clostridia bacterium]